MEATPTPRGRRHPNSSEATNVSSSGCPRLTNPGWVATSSLRWRSTEMSDARATGSTYTRERMHLFLAALPLVRRSSPAIGDARAKRAGGRDGEGVRGARAGLQNHRNCENVVLQRSIGMVRCSQRIFAAALTCGWPPLPDSHRRRALPVHAPQDHLHRCLRLFDQPRHGLGHGG